MAHERVEPRPGLVTSTSRRPPATEPPEAAPHDTGAWRRLDTPIGTLVLEACGGALTAVRFAGAHGPEGGVAPRLPRTGSASPAGAALETAAVELEEYFTRRRRVFTVTLAPRGTAFQCRVWRALCRVPYGATVSYGELARRAGHAGAARAVGRANACNPLAVLVPCHRVVGGAGALTGYGGGLEAKRLLLDLEAGPGAAGAVTP